MSARSLSVWTALLFLLLSQSACSSRCVVKKGEELQFYPTYARKSPDGNAWIAPVRAQLYEPKKSRLMDGFFLGLRTIGRLATGEKEALNVEQRVRPFFAEPKGERMMAVAVGKERIKLGKTNDAGYASGEAAIPFKMTEAQNAAPASGARQFSLEPACSGADRGFSGTVHLLEDTGLSVISDVEDTVWIASASVRSALLANTFFRDYRPVPGMSEVYSRWAADGAAFHYVSNAPWQLYEPMSRFLNDYGFPAGTLHLREMEARKLNGLALLEAALDVFSPSRQDKLARMEEFLVQFPSRKFVLVGQADGADPEIFGELARKHPTQIERIYLRDASGAVQRQRFENAFQGVPAHLWKVFQNSSQI